MATANEKQSQALKTSGSAVTKTPRRATIALAEALSKQELERFTSDTFATATAATTILSGTPQSTSSVTDMLPNGIDNTVWEQSGSAYVEQGCPSLTEAEWSVLPPHQFNKLKGISFGRGESLEETLRAAVLWLMELEAPVVYEGNLKDITEFYLDNLCI